MSDDYGNIGYNRINSYGAENVFYLPLAWYGLRWNIEVSYYGGKTFWSMEEYRIRSKEGIERLINLISLSYRAMTLLPYSDEIFSRCHSASAQETVTKSGSKFSRK
jgi:hypothetical protein